MLSFESAPGTGDGLGGHKATRRGTASAESRHGSKRAPTLPSAVVRMRGPSSVTATVCSKWAESEPSAVEIDHSSSCDDDVGPAGGDHRLDRERHPGPEQRARGRARRSSGSAAPRASSARRRGRRGCGRPRSRPASVTRLDGVRDVAEPVAGAACSIPASSAAWQTSSSRWRRRRDLADRRTCTRSRRRSRRASRRRRPRGCRPRRARTGPGCRGRPCRSATRRSRPGSRGSP